MVKLSRSIVELMVIEHGRETFLERISDPFWFQSLGCVLGFDWHSSGLTTTLCGALKEALKDMGGEVGLFCAGGKGKTAINTPLELDRIGEAFGINTEELKDTSRLVAKVDNTLLQDGYQIYHHVVFFTSDCRWAIVQQGMNERIRYARRYHWLGENVTDMVEEPHSGIASSKLHKTIALNMTDRESRDNRNAIKELLKDRRTLLRELDKVEKLTLPERHHISPQDIDLKKLRRSVERIEENINTFEDILKIRGIGAKTIRALALIADLIYGAKPSFKDPANYTFAHGGKDGHPYPVQRDIYDATIDTLKKAIEKAKIGNREKIEALKKLSRILND